MSLGCTNQVAFRCTSFEGHASDHTYRLDLTSSPEALRRVAKLLDKGTDLQISFEAKGSKEDGIVVGLLRAYGPTATPR